MKRLLLVAVSLVCGISLVTNEAFTLDYPTREIEFIAGFAPGSNTDLFARLAAKYGEKYVGKPIIVVNKPGGGGALGFEMLACSPMSRPGNTPRPCFPISRQDKTHTSGTTHSKQSMTP